MQDKPKRPSGAEYRRRRVARGLPRNTTGEIESRRRNSKQPNTRARRVRWVLSRSADNRQFVNELKVRLGCADCGYNAHPAALDFDHLPGSDKIRGVAAMVNFSRNALVAEIAKCECVCANCHRIRTWQRRRDGHTAVQDALLAEDEQLTFPA